MVDYSIGSVTNFFYICRDRPFVTFLANKKRKKNNKKLITNCVINKVMSTVLSNQSRNLMKLKKANIKDHIVSFIHVTLKIY